MKLFTKILALTIVTIAGAWVAPPKASAQETSVSFQLFYDQLSPYGSWVDYQNYGYVWIPDVGEDFTPYGSEGHWVLTDDGWTWASDYSWGWAPFHYGRWAHDDSYGWLWVPQNEWGPAWVTWRRSEGYYGWAAMSPGISIEASFGGGNRESNDRWTFVSDRDMNRPDIDRHYVNRSTNITIINNSTVIQNTYTDKTRQTRYVSGPGRDDVQRVTGATIRPVAIRENDKPGQTMDNNQLRIYRPRVQMNNNNDHKPAPSRVVALKEVKPVSERRAGNQIQNANAPEKRRDESSAPLKSNLPENKTSTAQPQPANPAERNRNIQEPPKSQTVTPTDNKGRGQEPRVADPRYRNPNVENPPKPQPEKPTETKIRGEEPPAANPRYKNPVIENPPKPQPVNPTDNKGRGQAPRIADPRYKDKSIVVPPHQQTVRPIQNTPKGQRTQQIANPPANNKNANQPSKPAYRRPPNAKRQPPQNAAPPNNKGKGRDIQTPKPDHHRQDSTKNGQ